jgi:hypothetical protein
MSSFLSHRRKAFRGGGAVTLPEPIHFFQLDNITTGLDDLGTGGTGSPWARLTNNGTTIDANADPSGAGDTVVFASSVDYINRSDVAWDGARDELTMTCWYKMSSINTSANYLVSWRGTDSTAGRLTQMQVQNSTQDYLGGAVFDDVNSELMFLNDQSINNVTSQWYFGAVTFKGGTGKIYRATQGTDTLDLHESETNAGLVDFTTNTMPFSLGVPSWSTGLSTSRHNGNLWSVGIWDEELSSEQLQAIYDQQEGGDLYGDFTWT